MMSLHHIVTAVLCIGSWATGYIKIGSVVMLLHDISDIPLDLVRIGGILNYQYLQIASAIVTIGAWIYWRLVG